MLFKVMCQKFFKFKKKFSFLCTLPIILLCTAAILLCTSCHHADTNVQFLPRTCYYLYAECDGTEHFLQKEREKLRLDGWAGEIVEYLGKKYLLAEVFLERLEAQRVLAEFVQTYSGAGILEITDHNFSRGQQAKLSANYASRLFFSRVRDFSDQLLESSDKLIGGQISAAQFFAQLSEFSLNLQCIDCAGQGELGAVVEKYRQKIVQELDNFEQNYQNVEMRNSNLRALGVKLVHLSQELTIEFSKVC